MIVGGGNDGSMNSVSHIGWDRHSVEDATMRSIEIISLPFGQTRELEMGFNYARSDFAMITVGGSFPR